MLLKFTLLIFFLLTVTNLLIYLNRNKGFEYVEQSSYRQLYPNTSKGIVRIDIQKEPAVVIALKGYSPTAKWNVKSNDSLIIKDQLQPLQFSLKENVNRYVLSSTDSAEQPIVIDIDYAPAALYKQSGSNIATNYEIRYCSAEFLNEDSSSVTRWKDELQYTDTAELNVVKHLLADSLNIKPQDSTVKKINIIGHYIYQSVKQSMGVPPDSLAKYSVYKQFCLAKNNNNKIWCGNIAAIFHLFASSAGIVCRNIGISGKRGSFGVGSHAVNESYLPETGEWAYTDVTQNVLLLRDSTKKILNTVDLYQLKKLQQAENITSYSSGDSGVIAGYYTEPDKKYLWRENEILFPHPYNPATLYSAYNKFKRYNTSQSWFEIYSENNVYSNEKFYLKIYLLYTWLVFALLTAVLYLVNAKQRRK
jgi:lipoprotein-anchoring transpeptidase ErfK/SrfK